MVRRITTCEEIEKKTRGEKKECTKTGIAVIYPQREGNTDETRTKEVEETEEATKLQECKKNSAENRRALGTTRKRTMLTPAYVKSIKHLLFHLYLPNIWCVLFSNGNQLHGTALNRNATHQTVYIANKELANFS